MASVYKLARWVILTEYKKYVDYGQVKTIIEKIANVICHVIH